MNDGFSQDPLDADEAAQVRKMLHDWNDFSDTHKGVLVQAAWVIKNWRIFALVAVLGAAGAFKNLLEGVKSWW